MSAYEELVERVATEVREYDYNGTVGGATLAIRILAEVLRAIQPVTPEMERAWGHAVTLRSGGGAARDWLAMLHASPLVPPK